MIRRVLFIAALVAFTSPVPAAAAAKEIDWKKVFQSAVTRKQELDAKGQCGGVPASDIDARTKTSREYARSAAGLDLAVHSILETMPEHASKTPSLVEDAVDAYERSFDCLPVYENRHSLAAADELLAFVQTKFTARQHPDEREYVARFQGLRDGVRAKQSLPPPPPRRPESCSRCDAPTAPPELDTRGCSLPADRTGWPLVVITLLWVRRRRR